MNPVALVPVNRLAAVKTRLAGALPPDERRRLVLWMARRTVGTLLASDAVAGVLVVSPDREALAATRRPGVTGALQREGGLNEGLELGRQRALAAGAEALLVVLADLPYLTPEQVAALVALGDGSPGEARVVLAPDARGRGTNALLVRPASLVPFTFGAHSLARHRALARYTGVEPAYYRSPGTARDVDTPGDLRQLVASGLWAPESHAPWARGTGVAV